jgi:hypothetical protein
MGEYHEVIVVEVEDEDSSLSPLNVKERTGKCRRMVLGLGITAITVGWSSMDKIS